MNWFLAQSTEVQVAVVAAVLAAIGVLIAILQYRKSANKTKPEQQSVTGKGNKTVQVGTDNNGNINIK
ncbi:hypothetical protein [Bowmanella denitrificans]|uniref:hypothetical protein n=1 Tax=Bowmanella denitrificans TaxID=366582 RepID=UPI000C9C819E|nr:hypothetical protein [Bowmanella denitrificans]